VPVALALAAPFSINAGLLAIGAALVFALAGTFAPKGRTTTGRIAWRAEIGEGFRWLWNHHLLRALALLLGAMNLLSSLAFVIVVLFAQETLGLLEGWRFGLVLTGTATGAVIGSLFADRVERHHGLAAAPHSAESWSLSPNHGSAATGHCGCPS
jgi:hypothetical protein